jgi:hypothetical protein
MDEKGFRAGSEIFGGLGLRAFMAQHNIHANLGWWLLEGHGKQRASSKHSRGYWLPTQPNFSLN